MVFGKASSLPRAQLSATGPAEQLHGVGADVVPLERRMFPTPGLGVDVVLLERCMFPTSPCYMWAVLSLIWSHILSGYERARKGGAEL